MSGGDVQFTYVDEDPQQGELEHWRKFAAAGRGRSRARLRLPRDPRLTAGVAAGLVTLLVSLLVWQPWSSRLDAAERALGADSAAMLVQLRDSEGRAVASAIVLHDRTGPRGSIVGIPDNMAVDVPVVGTNPSASGNGVTTISEAAVVAGEAMTRDALADLLGVEIDGSLVVDVRRFGALVDRLGGVEIDSVRMDGDIAIARATAPSDPPAVRAERFAQLLDAVALAFPEWERALELVDSVGLTSRTTLSAERLAAILVGTHRDRSAGSLRSGVLPLRSDGMLDLEAATPMVLDLLDPQVRERSEGDTPRVIVLFATGPAEEQTRLEVAARVAVVNAGYRFIDGGTVDPQPSSSVTTYGNTGIGDSIARVLGFDSGVVASGDGRALADAVVVLGQDYKP